MPVIPDLPDWLDRLRALTLAGSAGTNKSDVALLAALSPGGNMSQSLTERYDRPDRREAVVQRPIGDHRDAAGGSLCRWDSWNQVTGPVAVTAHLTETEWLGVNQARAAAAEFNTVFKGLQHDPDAKLP